MSPKTLTVATSFLPLCDPYLNTPMEEFVNTADWIPAKPSNFGNTLAFSFDAAETCAVATFSWNLKPVVMITTSSDIIFTFDKPIDLLTGTTFTLSSLNPNGVNSFIGKLNANFPNGVNNRISVFSVKLPNISTTFKTTLATLNNGFKVHEGTISENVIRPSIITRCCSVTGDPAHNIITEGCTYKITITGICGTLTNPSFVVVFPPIFSTSSGGSSVTIPWNGILNAGNSKEIEVPLINPGSARTGNELMSEIFTITVNQGTDTAFVLRDSLPNSYEIKPGTFSSFILTGPTTKGGEVCTYTFTIGVEHMIPNAGKLRLTLDPSVIWQNEISSISVINTGSANFISAGNIIEIVFNANIVHGNLIVTLINIKNPLMVSVYDLFNVISTDLNNRLIDTLSTSLINKPTVTITQPGDANVDCTMSSSINIQRCTYSCTFNSFGIGMPYGTAVNTLRLTIPAEVTCYARIEPPSATLVGNVMSYSVTAPPVTSITMKIDCQNPETTEATGNFDFLLLDSGNSYILSGKDTVATTKGTELRTCSFLLDERYPQYKTKCSLTIEKVNGHGVTSVVVTNKGITLGTGCTVTGGTCTTVNGRLTVSFIAMTNDNPILIQNIPYINPNNRDQSDYTTSITTYYTSGNYVVDESIGLSATACNIVVDCNYPCLTCSNSADFCVSCTKDSTNGKFYYLYRDQGLCQPLAAADSCDTGYYKEDAPERLCLNCDPKCRVCVGASSYCLSCANPSDKFYNNDCYATCPPKTYLKPEEGRCYDCPIGCQLCTSQSICTKCEGIYYLHETSCVRNCPDKTYKKVDTNTCEPCDDPCATCIKAGECITCIDGLFLKGTQCVTETVCTAGKGFVADASTKECIACEIPCLKCQTRVDTCLECNNPTLVLHLNKCLSRCPDGFYQSGSVCNACSIPCLTCTDQGANKCTSCINGYYLIDGTNTCSLNGCPHGYFLRNNICYVCSSTAHCVTCIDSATKCTSCEGIYNLYNNVCIENCPSGRYASSNECLLCDPSCYTCEGTASDCTSCKNPYPYLNGHECLSACPDRMTPLNGVCQYCNITCASCVGSVDFCVTCTGSNFAYGGICAPTCPPNTTAAILGKICIQCQPGCEQCSWGTSTTIPEICIKCLPGYKYVDFKCYSICPSGYTTSSDGLTCIKTSGPFPDEKTKSSGSFLPFPHLIAACFLGLIILFGYSRDNRSLLVSSLIVVVNYVAICSYVFQIVWAYTEDEFILMIITAAPVIVQVFFNILFCIPYNQSISTDTGFIKWKEQHFCAKTVIMIFSTIFTIQTARLFYSRFMGFNLFFAKFEDFNNVFGPINNFSLFQIALVHCVIALLDIFSLTRLSWGNMLYITIIETLVLSVILLLLFAFEIKNTKEIIDGLKDEEIKDVVVEDHSMAQSRLFDEESFKKDLLASIMDQLKLSQSRRDLEDRFRRKKPKRRHSHAFVTDYDKEKDPRKLKSYPCSPKTAKQKKVPLKKYGYNPKAVKLPHELPDNVYSDSVPKKESVVKDQKDYGQQTPPFQKLDIFRMHMNLPRVKKKKIFERSPNPLEMIPEKPEEDETKVRKKFDMMPIRIPSSSAISSLVEEEQSKVVNKPKRLISPPQVTEESLMLTISNPLKPVNEELLNERRARNNASAKEETKILITPNKIPEVFEDEEYKYHTKSIKEEEKKVEIEQPILQRMKRIINDEDIMGTFNKDPKDGYILINENKDGILMDLKERPVNKYGYLIDKDGNLINQKGEFIMSKEDLDRELGEDSSYIRKTIPKNNFVDKEEIKVPNKFQHSVTKLEEMPKERISEERKSVSLDLIMDDTPSNYNIQNQRYNDTLHNLQAKKKSVRQINQPQVQEVPTEDMNIEGEKIIRPIRKRKKRRIDYNKSSYKRNFEKAFQEKNQRKYSSDMKDELEEAKVSEDKSDLSKEAPHSDRSQLQHSASSDRIKDLRSQKMIAADLANNDVEGSHKLENMFLPSDPDDAASVSSKGPSLMSQASNSNLRMKNLESIYLQKIQPARKQPKKKEVDTKNKLQNTKEMLKRESSSDKDEVGTFLTENYKAMQKKFKETVNSESNIGTVFVPEPLN